MSSEERYLHSSFAGASLFERYIEWVGADAEASSP